MDEAMATPHTPSFQPVLDRFLAAAQVRGERGVAIARLIGCGLVLMPNIIRILVTNFGDSPKQWIIDAALLAGVFFSLWVLTRGRRSQASEFSLLASIFFDLAMVGTILGTYVVWRFDTYTGILHLVDFQALIMAVVASGLRLSRRGTVLSASVGALLILILLAIEQHNAEFLTYDRWDFFVLFGIYSVAVVLSFAFSHRTVRLVHQGAVAALDAERQRQRLGVYISQEFAAASGNSEQLELGGERRPVAILFTDLRGFTAYSEALKPEALVAELNAYLDDMVRVLRRHGGVVDKYIGDAIMAVFGVNDSADQAAVQALWAAAKMQQALTQHNQRRKQKGLHPLRHGLGVHFGEVVIGNIGTSDRMQYTVVGAAVNLASRLESATKDQGVEMLASAAIVDVATETQADLPSLRPLGPLNVRGLDAAVEVYEIGTPLSDM